MDRLSGIGAASSVIGIASFGIQLAQVLYRFTDQALSAEESLHSIWSGIHATTSALNQVHEILAEECEHVERHGRAIFFSAKAINDVKGTADRCLLIFWRIEATITSKTGSNFEKELTKRLKTFNEELAKKKRLDPIPIDRDLISLTRWGRLRWPLIAPKLDSYNNQLQQLQMNLVLMFSVISLGAHRRRP
jgi:ABC-type multidrug transport system fused ATPase/permease subunit